MSLNGPPVAEVLELFFRSHAHTLLFDRAKNSKDVYKPEKRYLIKFSFLSHSVVNLIKYHRL